ncbi:Peptidase, M48 family [Rubellimicrobium mesophilum DSM 19309]|uniref:Peptidase, M48 family n=1 Tax=Rubellimicrobium mesophilum DSM 19309 TaxID=442562 RepID=A0A017HJH3_9RHOB|nr:M48 family metallopeptidase [Rubellimicrobium mesophilum]EYD74470.1 Peptidase, M48 family [Rubellimicrobium mesophilum DSM 19309]
MIRLLPLLLLVAAAIVYARTLAWRTARELDRNSVELADPGLRTALARLAEALEIPRIRVHLYEVPAINGLASHDGRIFITRGFYERFRAGQVTAEEMASVVAHELGHVALGHSRRRMIDFTGQNAVRMGLALVLGRLLPGLGVWIAQGLVSLLAAGLSRRDEYEADAYATALLIKAGIGAGPQKSLFRKLGAMAGHGAQAPAWLLTHPRTEERIRAIEANEARWLRTSPDAPA